MDLILLTIFLVTAFLALLPLFKKWKDQFEFSQIINKIPGPKAYPFFGTTLPYIMTTREDRFNLTAAYGKQYGPIYRMWHGRTFPEVRIMACDYAEEIFKSSKHIEKSFTYKLLEPWLGQGLISSTGQHWFTHRRLITPTFHFSILENFCDVFYEHSEVLVKNLEKLTSDGETINIYPIICNAALDIICETAMGIKVNALESDNDYVKAVYRFSEIAMHRFYKPWLRINFFFNKSSYIEPYTSSLKSIHDMTTKVIKERKLSRQMKKANGFEKNENDFGIKKRQAFLDLLLDGNETNTELTDKDLQDEVNTFMFAGHDTTSVGICWALYLIGLHADIQEKIYEEMNEIFGGDNTKPAKYRDLNEMKYLERVLKESLRIYPSVPNVSRKLNEDIEIGGYKIPKNTILALQIYFIHRDERFFKDPERFDPDRFLPENMEGRHSYAFVPFAAGPRNCIGQRFALLEEKSVVSTIVRNFKIKSTQQREDIKLLQEVVLRPVDGIQLKLERRR